MSVIGEQPDLKTEISKMYKFSNKKRREPIPTHSSRSVSHRTPKGI